MHPLVTIIVVLVLFDRETDAAAVVIGNNHESSKAGWNLGSMTECVLGYSLCEYNHYGCWCGSGDGDDSNWEDDIDRYVKKV